jgi:hypothetical protein
MTYEQFDRMLEKNGNALVQQLTKDIIDQKITIEQAADRAASWHVGQMRKRYGGRWTPNYYRVLYTDLYDTAMHDFPYLVKRMQAHEPPIIPLYDKPVPLYDGTTKPLSELRELMRTAQPRDNLPRDKNGRRL